MVPLPAGCQPVLTANTITCPTLPPVVCPPGTTGTPPNCVPIPPPSGCAGFANTILLAMNWAAPQTLTTGMGPNDIVVVQLTTGASVNQNQYGNITGAEYQSQPSARIAALTAKPCDFGNALGDGAQSTSNTVTVNFSVGANGSRYYPALAPSTVYYFNVKNAANSTCASTGICNMYYQLHRPPNT